MAEASFLDCQSGLGSILGLGCYPGNLGRPSVDRRWFADSAPEPSWDLLSGLSDEVEQELGWLARHSGLDMLDLTAEQPGCSCSAEQTLVDPSSSDDLSSLLAAECAGSRAKEYSDNLDLDCSCSAVCSAGSPMFVVSSELEYCFDCGPGLAYFGMIVDSAGYDWVFSDIC